MAVVLGDRAAEHLLYHASLGISDRRTKCLWSKLSLYGHADGPWFNIFEHHLGQQKNSWYRCYKFILSRTLLICTRFLYIMSMFCFCSRQQDCHPYQGQDYCWGRSYRDWREQPDWGAGPDYPQVRHLDKPLVLLICFLSEKNIYNDINVTCNVSCMTSIDRSCRSCILLLYLEVLKLILSLCVCHCTILFYNVSVSVLVLLVYVCSFCNKKNN